MPCPYFPLLGNQGADSEYWVNEATENALLSTPPIKVHEEIEGGPMGLLPTLVPLTRPFDINSFSFFCYFTIFLFFF